MYNDGLYIYKQEVLNNNSIRDDETISSIISLDSSNSQQLFANVYYSAENDLFSSSSLLLLHTCEISSVNLNSLLKKTITHFALGLVQNVIY